MGNQKLLVAAALACAACLLSGFALWLNREHWPETMRTPEFVALAHEQELLYIKNKINTHLRAQDYSADGDYLNYGKYVFHSPGPRLRLDEKGLPQLIVAVDYNGTKEWQHVPGNLANFALASHGRYIMGKGTLEQFIDAADKLVELVGPDGALRNNYRFRHYSQPKEYPIGWISGMDQGLALSVFHRAYTLTKDRKYLDAGERAYHFLMRAYPDGPRNTLADLNPSLKSYIWFDEYLAEPNVYTLNGYMFTLFGLYDWSQTGSKEAGETFEKGLDSLEKMLPYYDLGFFSAYDLSFMTNPGQKEPHFGTGYHGLHAGQLKALYSITGRQELNRVADRWLRDVNAGPDAVYQ